MPIAALSKAIDAFGTTRLQPPLPDQGPDMTEQEIQAILTLSVLAAFVDGDKHERERAEIKRIAEGLATDERVHLPSLYQDVLMKRVSIASAAKDLSSLESKQLAYEMAVCVCDADGAQSEAEQRFLQEVRSALALAAPAATEFSREAEALAEVPLKAAGSTNADAAWGSTSADAAWGNANGGSGNVHRTPSKVPGTTGNAHGAPGSITGVPGNVNGTSGNADAGPGTAGTFPEKPAPDNAELDRTILNASILNGALELLPETLSTMAIIPLQMKLVYRIGQAHGYELDRGHIKDFLAAAGVGMTSQFMEQAGRKLLGGLLGKLGGGMGRGLGKQAVSSGMSFASTYALGHVAKRYYAGGRQLSAPMLKEAYAGVVQEARNLQTQYLPAIQDKARTLDTGKVLALVRGA
jgi:uncharacterized protein (DUF697 family)/tellurite resistance protein